MKQLLILSAILFFLLPLNSLSQEMPLIEGTFAKIYLNNGSIIQGKVQRVNMHDVTIQLIGNQKVFNFKKSEINKVEPIRVNYGGSLGLGFGIPYGILGLNFDLKILDHLDFSAGIGTTIFAGPSYNAGLKLYALPPSQQFRPRISGYYGINAMVISDDDVYQETFTGPSFGIGLLYIPVKPGTKIGIDFDLIIISTSSDYEDALEEMRNSGYEVTETGNIKFSMGLRIGF